MAKARHAIRIRRQEVIALAGEPIRLRNWLYLAVGVALTLLVQSAIVAFVVTMAAVVYLTRGVRRSRASIVAGLDGLTISGAGARRLILYRDIETVKSVRQAGDTPPTLTLTLRNGDEVKVSNWLGATAARREKNMDAASDAIERRMSPRLPSGPAANLARNKRSIADWLEGLRELATPGAPTYRGAQLSDDGVLEVLLDDDVILSARLGAALVLCRSHRASGRAALRALSHAVVDPAGRLMLRRAARARSWPRVTALLEESADRLEADDDADGAPQ